MPECARCHDFTDNSSSGDYHYCDDCLDRFAEIERSGVIVEGSGSNYEVVVTDAGAQKRGGQEYSQVDALARGKLIADEHGLDALFKYEETGSRWLLDEYLRTHSSIRQDVHERLRRVPDNEKAGLLATVRDFLN